ncbi:hypothetical protein BDR06DRAFT_974742 [Suillus hirtellus]|nr:hypothetical protein BDR06DRAFT_974742 [Suillus hirtellus]
MSRLSRKVTKGTEKHPQHINFHQGHGVYPFPTWSIRSSGSDGMLHEPSPTTSTVTSSSPAKTEDKLILSHNKSLLPDWWKTPDSKKFPIKTFLFRALCLISVARPSVDHCWQSFTDDDEWEKQQRKIINRLCNTNIVAGLVVLSAV